MYTPRSFEFTDLGAQHQAIKDHPFGALVVHDDGALAATHLPFLLTGVEQGMGVLQAHVARSNTEFSMLADNTPVLAIFQGPHAYVSPTWYPAKNSSGGKAVPTWNYVSVHVHGTLSTVSCSTWLLTHLGRQTRRFEEGREHPWAIEDAPADYIDAMVKNIVGLEITITSIEGKKKLSQNRSLPDQDGVIKGLSQGPLMPTAAGFNQELAQMMRCKR